MQSDQGMKNSKDKRQTERLKRFFYWELLEEGKERKTENL